MSPPRAVRLPRAVRALLAASLVSAVGSGLTLPFLLIYLHEVRHIPLAATGLLIGGAAVVSIPAGPATGSLIDRFGIRLLLGAITLLGVASAVGLIFVRSAVSALPVLFLYGLANGSMWPAWNALLAVTIHDETLRPRAFARNFQLLNLGLGAGALVAGAVVRVSHPASFELIYLIDAVTFLAILVALFLLPAADFVRAAEPAGSHERPRGGYREVLADRRFRRYLIGALLLAFAGYGAIDAGLVGYATVVVRVHPAVIAWAFGANTGLIVVAQPLALKITARLRRSNALIISAGFFAASWGVLLVAGAFPNKTLGAALVVTMFAVFAVGEVLLSPVAGPLITVLARPSLQGRYNAIGSSVYTVTNVVGPALAGGMLAAHLGDAYLALLVASAGLSALAFRWMRRILSDRIDNADRGKTPHLRLEDEIAAAG